MLDWVSLSTIYSPSRSIFRNQNLINTLPLFCIQRSSKAGNLVLHLPFSCIENSRRYAAVNREPIPQWYVASHWSGVGMLFPVRICVWYLGDDLYDYSSEKFGLFRVLLRGIFWPFLFASCQKKIMKMDKSIAKQVTHILNISAIFCCLGSNRVAKTKRT